MNKLNTVLGTFGLGVIIGALIVDDEHAKNAREWQTCYAIAEGNDPGKVKYIQGRLESGQSLELAATNSITALQDACKTQYDISVTQACAADSIKKAVSSGIDVRKALVEEAQKVEGSCWIDCSSRENFGKCI